MLYTLPPEQDFGHFLANAISSYSQGKQQYQQNRLNKMLTEIKLQDMLRKQKMTDAFTKFYDSLTGGAETGADTGTDVLPGLEGKPFISSVGSSGPRISLPKPKTQMDLISDIAAVAKQISELPEDSSQRSLAETTLMSLRKQLAGMQDQEIEPPEKRYKYPSLKGIPALGTVSDWLAKDISEKVIPKKVESRDVPAKSREVPRIDVSKIKDQDLGVGIGVPGLPIKEKLFGIGKGVKAGKYPRVPGSSSFKRPPVPTDPTERKYYDSIDWFKLPTSKQAQIWKARDNEWTWQDIANALKGETNAKPK